MKVFMKKIGGEFLKRFRIAVLGGFAVFGFTTCDMQIGLGAAVDTISPKVAITSPSTNYAVPGCADFSVEGTCWDDNEVESVSIVHLRNNDNPNISYDLKDVPVILSDGVDGKKDWTAAFNYLGNNIYEIDGKNVYLPDGTYIIDVRSFDASGRQSPIVSTPFIIDNTPPVFIVSQPSSLENSTTFAEFGQIVAISGAISDTNAIRSMKIRVYRCNDDGTVETEITDQLAISEFDAPEKANTYVEIARYSSAADSALDERSRKLKKNYLTLFDRTSPWSDAEIGKVAAKKFLVSVILTDVSGNDSTYSYISSGLDTFVRNNCPSLDPTITLDKSDYMKILNGLFTSTVISSADVAKIRKVMMGEIPDDNGFISYNIEGGEACRFSMNISPKNNPFYQVQGMEVKSNGGASSFNWETMSPGQTVTVTVNQGRDNIQVKPSEFEVKIYEANENWTKKSNEPVVWYANLKDTLDPTKPMTDNKFYRDTDETKCQSGDLLFVTTGSKNDVYQMNPITSGTFSLKLPTFCDLTPNRYYRIEITGTDQNGQQLVPYLSDYGYGFKYVTSGVAPVMSVSSGKWYKATDIDGTKKYTVTVADKMNQMKNGDAWVKYSISYLDGYYDTRNKASVASALLKSGDKELKGSTSSITDKGGSIFEAAIPLENLNGGVLSGKDNYTLLLKVWAYNGSVESNPAYALIYADRKAPVLEITNIKDGDTLTEKDSSYSAGELGQDSNYMVRGTWSDVGGSGTKTLKYNVNGSGWKTASEKDAAPGAINQTGWGISIPVSEGNLKIDLEAYDEMGNKSSKTVNAVVDFRAPHLKLTSHEGSVPVYHSNDVTFEFLATDSHDVSSIIITPKLDGGTPPAGSFVESGFTGGMVDGQYQGKKSITLKNTVSGKWTITAVAKDAGDQLSNQVEVSTIMDVTKPVVKTETLKIDGVPYSVDKWFSNPSVKIDGEVTEEDSGMKNVYFVVAKTGDTAIKSSTILKEVGDDLYPNRGESVPTQHGFSFVPAALSENEGTVANRVYVQIEDNAGNFSEPYAIDINVDLKSPQVASKIYTFDDSLYSPATGTVLSNGEKDLIVYGTITEAESGLASILIDNKGISTDATITFSTKPLGDSSANPADYKALSDVADVRDILSWRAVIGKDKAKTSGTVRAVTTDKAGNKSSATLFSLEIDNSKPSLKLTSPLTNDENPAVINGEITFKGTASDNALAKVELFWGLGSDDSDFEGNSFAEKEGASAYEWSGTKAMNSIPASTINFVDGTNYDGTSTKDVYIKVVATDKAGNSNSEVYHYVVDPKQDRPVITINAIDLTSMSDSQTAWLKNTTVLHGIVNDDDGVSSMSRSFDKGKSWYDVPLTNGAWTLDLEQEGPSSVYFKVVDNAGTEFISKAFGAKQYDCPILRDGRLNAVEGTSILNITSDKSAPEILEVAFKSESDDPRYIAIEDNNFAQEAFGGKYKKLTFIVKAFDQNGIAKGEVNFNGNKYELTATPLSANEYRLSNTTPIDLSAASGIEGKQLIPANITVYDNADMKSSKAVSISVDNEKPRITISAPSGRISTAASINGTVSETGGKVYFAVTKNDVEPNDINDFESSGTDAGNKWLLIENTNINWSVFFDNGAAVNHKNLLKYYIDYVGIPQDGTSVLAGTYGNEAPLRFHILAYDRCGNEERAYKDIQIDPKGDKPSVKISYPKKNAQVGGAVSIMGTAKDNIRANYVWVMIDMNGDGVWNYDDIRLIKEQTESTGKDPYLKWGHYNKSGVDKFAEIDIGAIPSMGVSDYSEYAIRVPVTGISWNFVINKYNEFVPAGESVWDLKVWAYATDDDGNASTVSNNYADIQDESDIFTYFKVDKDSPVILNQQFVQYDGENIIARQSYIEGSDISIRGKWFYEADFFDASGISAVMIDGVENIKDGAKVKNPTWYSAATSDDGLKGFHIKMPIGEELSVETVKSSSVAIKIYEVAPNSPKSTSVNVSYTLDNKKPVIAEQTDKSFNIAREEDGRVISNYGKFYTFGSTATELPFNNINQTGVDRVAFYFTRKIDSESMDCIYDIFEQYGKVNRSDLAFNDDDHLYWKEMEATASGATVTLGDSWEIIRVGGLVKINNIIYTIESVSADGKTIGLKDANIDSVIGGKAYFALAAVVDTNGVQESEGTDTTSAGYYKDIPNGDKDLLMESLVSQNGKWTWEANINSRTIEDGMAVLNYVVFDKAGNCAFDSVDVFIGNHQPRVAGVRASVDTNGNGSFENTEIVDAFGTFENGRNENGLDMTSVTFPLNSTAKNPSSIFAVKNKMRIEPEIVGGNGALYYSISTRKYDSTAENWVSASYTKSYDYTKLKDSTDQEIIGDDVAQQGFIDFSVNTVGDPNSMKGLGIVDGENQKLTVTIKDSALGKSMTCDLSLVLDFALDDKTKPVNRIRPFYWKSEKENSLFNNDRNQGHIDLPADFIGTEDYENKWVKTGNDRFFYDDDPKVSGKIKIEGVATDEHLLSKISINLFGTEFDLATYDAESSTWTPLSKLVDGNIPDSGWAVDVEDATYGDYLACGYISSIPIGKSEVTKIEAVTQEYGHVAKWTLYLDTEVYCTAKKTYPVYVDFVVRAGASDRGSPNASGGYDSENSIGISDKIFKSGDAFTQSGGNDGSGEINGTYKFDVVPYLLELRTMLTQKNAVPSMYGRTAKGAYSIGNKEVIALKGFNLGKNAGTGYIKSYMEGVTTTDPVVKVREKNFNNTYTYNESTGWFEGITASTLGDQGMLSLKVQGYYCTDSNKGTMGKLWITTFNNMNDNSAEYNIQANKKNNNSLTDDVRVELWNQTELKKPSGATALLHPTLKVDPSTGVLAGSMGDGQTFVMPGYDIRYGGQKGKKKSYSDMIVSNAEFKDSTFTFDANGNTFGVVQTGASNQPSQAGFFKLALIEQQPTGNNNHVGGYYINGGSRLEASSINIDANPKPVDQSQFGMNLNRIVSPAMTTRVLEDGNTMVYIAYCDTATKQIRFRRGIINAKDYKSTATKAKDDGIDIGTGNGNLKYNKYFDVNHNWSQESAEDNALHNIFVAKGTAKVGAANINPDLVSDKYLASGMNAFRTYKDTKGVEEKKCFEDDGLTDLGSSLRDLGDFETLYRLTPDYLKRHDFTGYMEPDIKDATQRSSNASGGSESFASNELGDYYVYRYSYPFSGTPIINATKEANLLYDAFGKTKALTINNVPYTINKFKSSITNAYPTWSENMGIPYKEVYWKYDNTNFAQGKISIRNGQTDKYKLTENGEIDKDANAAFEETLAYGTDSDIRYRYPPDSLQTLSGQTIFVVAADSNGSSATVGRLYSDDGPAKNANGFGLYCDIAVSPNGNVAILWFDERSSALKMAYLTEAQIAAAEQAVMNEAGEDNYTGRQNRLDNLCMTRNELINNQTITIANGGGTYGKIAFDPDGNIHIGYAKGGVNYAYIPCGDNVSKIAGNVVTMSVDTFATTGDYLTMNLGKTENNEYKPYFAYFAGGKAKYAYCAEFNDDGFAKNAGIVKGKYTGDWEIGYVPTTDTVTEDRVNVAVYVDKHGILQKFPKKGTYEDYSAATVTYPSTDPLVGFVNGQGKLMGWQIMQN